MQTPNDVDLIIFDMDGTILPSMKPVYEAIKRAFAKLGWAVRFREEDIKKFFGTSSGELYPFIMPAESHLPWQEVREKIRAEAEAFRSMHAKLAEKYLGQYVAIHNREIVDHDEDFQVLHTRIRQRFGSQPVLLRLVEAEPERVLTFRSPRLERGQP